VEKLTAVIGDVHGCTQELKKLISTLLNKGVGKFVFAGDLLDRGPDSVGAVRVVRKLAETKEVVLVKGNHEEKHERFRKHIKDGARREYSMAGYKELFNITSNLEEEDISFLDTAVLYHQMHFGNHDILVVHAGIPPIIKRLLTIDELNSLSSKMKKYFNQVLRVRYVNPKGYMVMLGAEKPEDVYWAEIYDGRFGHVYFGHQPFSEETAKKFPHATGIDLGCVFGDKMCAAVFNSLTGENVEFVYENALQKYAKRLGE